MIKPRILVIDDQYGDSRSADGATREMQEFLVRSVDPGGRCEFVFCSGQDNGRNSLRKITDVVDGGWPPRHGGASWSLVLLDVAFTQSPATPQDRRWGFTVLGALREPCREGLPVVMLTQESDARSEANWQQADGFMRKPSAESTDTAGAFKRSLYSVGLFPDLREGSPLAGRSLAHLRVLQQARQFASAPLGSGRILYGETGTGKTELARFIHDEMRVLAGRTGPFVSWSAVGSEEGIAKSALFGVWKGGHSEAETSQAGEIEKADGGTFFLDEVASLPHGLQALFIESRRRRDGDLRRLISRMGTFPSDRSDQGEANRSVIPGSRYLTEDRKIAVDVVMLTASNVNLHDEEVADRHAFRRDLLNDLGTPVFIPGLNERREDIGEIFEQIVRRICRDSGIETMSVHPDVHRLLADRDWSKSNIVGLRRIAEHAIGTARDFAEILIRHLPVDRGLPRWAGDGRASDAPAGEPPSTLPQREARPAPSLSELADFSARALVPSEPAALRGILPKLQEAHARLLLRVFGAALRATADRSAETTSLRAVCLLLDKESLRAGTSSSPETSMAHDVLLRILCQGDLEFAGLKAAQCSLLSDDPEVKKRVDQALSVRRRPVSTPARKKPKDEAGPDRP